MKPIVTYLLSMLLVGCTLSETTTITVNRKPGLAISLDMTNVSRADLYVFGPDGLFVDSILVQGQALQDTLTLLDGVEHGQYTVVSFLNSNRFSYTKLTKGVSTVEDLKLEMVATRNSDDAYCDTVLHGLQTFDVQRGDRPLQSINWRELYYNVEVAMSGFNLSRPIKDLGVEFRRVPIAFNGDGNSLNPMGYFYKKIKATEPVVTWSLLLNRFADEHLVELHAMSGEKSLGSVVVRPSELGVDYKSKESVTLRVELVMQSAAIAVIVNDWQVGVIQLTSVGG